MVFIVVFSEKRVVASVVLLSAACTILLMHILSVFHHFKSLFINLYVVVTEV
jgi:hypothetical protein